MIRPVTPFDLWRAGWELWLLSAETAAVMSYRTMGMAGLWNTDAQETMRMWVEKPSAMLRAGHAASLAAAAGSAPLLVMAAAAAPLRVRTRANAARLARRGPGRRRL